MLLDVVPHPRAGWTLASEQLPVVLRETATGRKAIGDHVLLAIWKLADGERSLGDISTLLGAASPDPEGVAEAVEGVADHLFQLRALGFRPVA